MLRNGGAYIALAVVGWIFLGVEEVGAVVYHQDPVLPMRLFLLVLAGISGLNVWAAVNKVAAPLRAAAALAAAPARKEHAVGEPTTGDLAFGLGREFERNLNGNGRLRAVSERHN